MTIAEEVTSPAPEKRPSFYVVLPPLNSESVKSCDLTTDPQAEPDARIVSLAAEALLPVIQKAFRQIFVEQINQAVSVRRSITLADAKVRYPRSEKVIQQLVEDPKNEIRHRWIAGRGRGGRELVINLYDIDRHFGVQD